MNYGMPYMGSKSKIADKIIEQLPGGGYFYDLFFGGGAITHAAMASGKWDKFVGNDVQGTVKFFKDCAAGNLEDKWRWVGRDDFERLKDTDLYVKICWSFGNNGNDYLYGRHIEPFKKAFHYAAVFNDYSMFENMGIYLPHSDKKTPYERKTEIGRLIKENHEAVKGKYIKYFLETNNYGTAELALSKEELKEKTATAKTAARKYLCDALRDSGLTQAEVNKRLGTQMANHYFWNSQWRFPTKEAYEKMREFMPGLTKEYDDIRVLKISEILQRLKDLQRLQSLESLQRLEALEQSKGVQNKSIIAYAGDYRSVPIKESGVIYCDIPYYGKEGYGQDFDYDAFYNWCERQRLPVYISEEYMPEARFVCVWQAEKRRTLGTENSRVATEKLWTVRK